MLRMLLALTCVLFTTACVGSAYQLPEVTNADVQAMQKKVSEKKSAVKSI